MNSRKYTSLNSTFGSTLIGTGATLALLVCAGSALRAEPGNDSRAPAVPAAIAVPGDTNKVHLHVYAIGWQIYTNDSTTLAWSLKAPEAVLFDANGNVVG